EFIFMPRELVVPEGIAEDYGFYNAEPGYEVGGVDHGAEEGEITALDALVISLNPVIKSNGYIPVI
ncbi:MAG: hypothetical protein IKW62_05940, partial [Clostridia bacterium]|nr:hypothetical protein [Clostridia bacterium]